MKANRKYAKRLIRAQAPVVAIELLKAFQLPKDQYNAVLHLDTMDEPLIVAAFDLHVSVSTLKRSYARALDNICKTVEQSPEAVDFEKLSFF